METTNLFKNFGKGYKPALIETNECVIYTRVSSAKQMDGLSLEVQLKGTTEYAEKNKLTILQHFGGTYESAAKDERKEFQRMIKYLKDRKQKVLKILVYSLERFSRNENSIWLSSQLRKLGTEIVSVTQPIDTSNPAGIMQQKMLFIFGEFDNQLRRQKSMAGVKEHLLQGEWVTAPPVGYDSVKVNRERKYVINETGLIIKKMFHWKAKERLPNVEIQKRLKAFGLNYNLRRINEIISNPFYCGKMVHKALEGEVVNGKHEKIVSEAIFLEANNILAQKKFGLQTKIERPEIALKRFVRCSNCNQPMRGYISNGYDVPYYKCNTIGCKCNRNANLINNQFTKLLDGFKIDEDFIPLLKDIVVEIFHEHNIHLKESEQGIKRQLTDMAHKLERLEERFITEELTAELYYKYKAKYEEEIRQIEAERANSQIEVSKLQDYINYSVWCCSHLSKMWQKGDYNQRQELQNAIFKDGIVYDRQKDECRSVGHNEFIIEIAQLSKDLAIFGNQKKNKVTLSSPSAVRAKSRTLESYHKCGSFFSNLIHAFIEINKPILYLFLITVLSGCNMDNKINPPVETQQKLLHVNAFDTLANISFPNYLSLDTNYTWQDNSDCTCGGRLKTRFQNKKDSSYKEQGFIYFKHPPKYRTYVTFIFPEYLKCFERNEIRTEKLATTEKFHCRNMMENDIFYSKIKNVRISSYVNSKNQRLAITCISFYMPKIKEMYGAVYVVTTNKRNNFPIEIKFEISTQSSIRDFINNCFKSVNNLEIK